MTARMLTTREVAERLRCTQATVSNHAKDGAIPGAVKVFGRWRFDPDTFDAWLASRVDVDTWAKPTRRSA